MPTDTISFTTGPALLPDVGECNYNGCEFSPLFSSLVSGNVVKDSAGRTTKYMEYTVGVDGYVTLPAGAADISATMNSLRQSLTAQAGHLVYRGRGYNLDVNPPGGGRPAAGQAFDVAWGPVPELIEFQPLGGGRSAKVQWKCKVRIPEITGKLYSDLGLPLLQHTFDVSVSYGEDGFSQITSRGTIEIPNTRLTKQSDRKIERTADDFRTVIDKTVMQGVDLQRFRFTRRNFSTSKDKRTLEWDLALDEKPFMDIPPDCTIARGQFTVRPATAGKGLVTWLCTLRATYTVRNDAPRRLAWLAFLALLRIRMSWAETGDIPNTGRRPATFGTALAAAFRNVGNTTGGWQSILTEHVGETTRPLLLDFSIDEGLYLDSKTTSFSATWRISTKLEGLLKASGLWRRVSESGAEGNNLWATSMNAKTGYAPNGIMSSQSWLRNRVDPKLDVIVDFGGP